LGNGLRALWRAASVFRNATLST